MDGPAASAPDPEETAPLEMSDWVSDSARDQDDDRDGDADRAAEAALRRWASS